MSTSSWSARPAPTTSCAMPTSCISTSKAGWERFLLGWRTPTRQTLQLIRKGGSDHDRPRGDPPDAPARHPLDGDLGGRLRGGDRSRSTGAACGSCSSYDPDQIQMLYVTPHRWTPYLPARRRTASVIQTDRRRWDYKHQVLATRHMPPWRVLLWFKFTEMVLQSRPKALCAHPVPSATPGCATRCAGTRRWAAGSGRTKSSAFCSRPPCEGRPDASREFWGAPQDGEEEAMSSTQPERRIAVEARSRAQPRCLDRPARPSRAEAAGTRPGSGRWRARATRSASSSCRCWRKAAVAR